MPRQMARFWPRCGPDGGLATAGSLIAGAAQPAPELPAPELPAPEESAAGQRAAVRPVLGTVAVLAGAVAWGSTGTAAHFAPAGASSLSVAAARIVTGGALLAAVALRRRESRAGLRALLRGQPHARALTLLAAVAVSGYQLCFFSCVRLTGVAVGTAVAIGSAPVLTGALSRLTGGPRLGRRWMAATAGAVAGVTVLVAGGQAASANPAGVSLALAAGLCYSVYALAAAGLISSGTPAASVMAAFFGVAAVLLLPVLVLTSPGWVLTPRGLAVTGYLGIVTTALAYLLYGRGLRTVPAPVAVTLGLAEPAVAAILGLTLLGEQLSGAGLAGLSLIGMALVVLAAPGRPDRAAAVPARPRGRGESAV
jgi:DME family drug/metabolite transporter